MKRAVRKKGMKHFGGGRRRRGMPCGGVGWSDGAIQRRLGAENDDDRVSATLLRWTLLQNILNH